MAKTKKLLNKDQVSDWIDTAAVAAMQGILASDPDGQLFPDKVAVLAYKYACALWDERNSNLTGDQ